MKDLDGKYEAIIQSVTFQIGVPLMTVWRILKLETLHRNHYSKVQDILELDSHCLFYLDYTTKTGKLSFLQTDSMGR